MLILAMPKTASTSLINTIRDAQSQYAICRLEHDKIKIPEFSQMAKFHSNIRLRDRETIERFVIDKVMIYRDHLVPVKEHLKELEKYKEPIIILLRNPEHVLDCYKRDVHFLTKRPDLKKLLKELIEFKEAYEKWAIGKKNVTIIYYKELVLHPNKTLVKILNLFGIKEYKIPEFRKDMFTGVGIKRLK